MWKTTALRMQSKSCIFPSAEVLAFPWQLVCYCFVTSQVHVHLQNKSCETLSFKNCGHNANMKRTGKSEQNEMQAWLWG